MNMRIVFYLFLMAFMPALQVSAKDSASSSGIVPATPPVNVYTSDQDVNYTGFGYLLFNVRLPAEVTPEFTLGTNEDAVWDIGENKFSSNGLVYVHEGKLRKNKSIEKAWIFGTIEGTDANTTFTRDGVTFLKDYQRSGFYLGTRNTSSERLTEYSSFNLDYSFTSMWAAFQLSGRTRIEAIGANYISDFDGNSVGMLYRPMITIQPVFSLGDSVKFIPFAGASAFISLDFSNWTVNEWQDELYGADCFDGCPDGDLFLNVIPFETFMGFDIEFKLSKGRISLSSFFSSGVVTNTESMYEVYVVYTSDF
ncbi:MAG: hypothetical protein OEY36_10755 [Gammaproteobacteria bacterium]|nr:hypothetical protein [Gammaproteobacteria bacterium]